MPRIIQDILVGEASFSRQEAVRGSSSLRIPADYSFSSLSRGLLSASASMSLSIHLLKEL